MSRDGGAAQRTTIVKDKSPDANNSTTTTTQQRTLRGEHPMSPAQILRYRGCHGVIASQVPWYAVGMHLRAAVNNQSNRNTKA
jgi:hypothetical protein